MELVKTFGSKIRHVDRKDFGQEWEEKRGDQFGCGMGSLTLGDGVIDLKGVLAALKEAQFDGANTLEISGPETLSESARRLQPH